MDLADLVTDITIKIEPDERWSVFGSEAPAFAPKLSSASENYVRFKPNIVPELDGLLLVGALSSLSEPAERLAKLAEPMKMGATLVIIDWQDDGPLNHGPDLDKRVKKGRARRLLREMGFGLVESLNEHPLYYMIKGVKGPAPPIPHADEYVEVARLNELPKNAMKRVEVFGHKIVIANTGREIVAFARACPHARGPLEKGLLRGRSVVCPLHGYIWNACTGDPVEPADEDTLQRYSVKIDVDGQRILVALGPP